MIRVRTTMFGSHFIYLQDRDDTQGHSILIVSRLLSVRPLTQYVPPNLQNGKPPLFRLLTHREEVRYPTRRDSIEVSRNE